MRRKIIVGLVLMLVLSSLNIISRDVSAQITKEDMTWSIGDKWEYRYTTVTPDQTMIFTMAIETTGESNVEIDGVNYDVFVAEITGELETVDIAWEYETTLAEGSTINGTMYVSKDNDNTVRTVQNLGYQLINATTGGSFDFEQSIVTVTNSTGGQPDVIDIGTSWVSTMKTITTTTTTLSGSIFEYLGAPGYSNTTTTTGENTVTYNYECTGKNNTTTTAGTFETYEIRQSVVGGQGYTLGDFSSTVKGEVKDTAYDNDGNIVSLMELLSYTAASTGSPSNQTKTPGFEVAIVFIAIVSLLFWKRKKI
jgi:hypothetical protein